MEPHIGTGNVRRKLGGEGIRHAGIWVLKGNTKEDELWAERRAVNHVVPVHQRVCLIEDAKSAADAGRAPRAQPVGEPDARRERQPGRRRAARGATRVTRENIAGWGVWKSRGVLPGPETIGSPQIVAVGNEGFPTQSEIHG